LIFQKKIESLIFYLARWSGKRLRANHR